MAVISLSAYVTDPGYTSSPSLEDIEPFTISYEQIVDYNYSLEAASSSTEFRYAYIGIRDSNGDWVDYNEIFAGYGYPPQTSSGTDSVLLPPRDYYFVAGIKNIGGSPYSLTGCTAEGDMTYATDTTTPTIAFTPASRDWDSVPIEVIVTANDNQSGIDYVQYAWSKTTSTPSIWTSFSNGSTITQTEQGEWYLHIKAVDNAGNVTTTYSGLYKLVKDFKVWNGTSFVNPFQPVKVWDGSSWIDAEVYSYDGANWVKKFGG